MNSSLNPRPRLVSILLLLGPCLGFSATISQTAMCNTSWQYQSNITANVGSASCAAQLNNLTATASTTASLSIVDNTLSFTTSGISSAPDAASLQPSGQFRSQCQRSYSLMTTIITSGTGLGYVNVSESGNQGSAGDGVSGVVLSGLPGLQACIRGSSCMLLPTLYQIELGTPITIDISGFTSADNGDNAGISGFNAQFAASFSARMEALP